MPSIYSILSRISFLACPSPGEHKTVQARILAYAQEIGWTYVSRARKPNAGAGLIPTAHAEERARLASLYFDDLLHAQVRAFNPKYKEAEGALVGELQRLNADIAGNREFLTYLRNQRNSSAPKRTASWT